MKGPLLLHLLFQAVLLYETLAWEVRMPKEIHGLKGSCLVIPCSFSYTSYPPSNPRRVVWYQWVSRGYPLVFDPWYRSDVIDKFRGRTELFTSSDQDCSLVIKSLDLSHNGEKLYAWIDPENIGWRTYKFYDVTSTIHVDSSPQQPTISISGGERTGDNIKVTCFTFHTCPYSKPIITLRGIEGTDHPDDVSIGNGLWKRTLTRTAVVKAESSDIECVVTHNGGITTSATKSQSAKCVLHNITIEPKRADVIEGVAKTFTCTIYHSCQKKPPTISWNYENMKVSRENKKLTGINSASFSSITFVGAKKDDGKKLICTAKISGQNIEAFVDLHVQQSGTKPVIPINEKPLKPVTPVQNITLLHEADGMTFDLKTIGLYIIIPSFMLLLIFILVGVIIYKRCNRSPDMQGPQPEQRINDTYAVGVTKPFSKPHMSSPQSERKSCSKNDYEDYYANMEDLNVYGNV